MIEFHVLTPVEEQLVMMTQGGRVVLVLPAPESSLPPAAATAHAQALSQQAI